MRVGSCAHPWPARVGPVLLFSRAAAVPRPLSAMRLSQSCAARLSSFPLRRANHTCAALLPGAVFCVLGPGLCLLLSCPDVAPRVLPGSHRGRARTHHSTYINFPLSLLDIMFNITLKALYSKLLQHPASVCQACSTLRVGPFRRGRGAGWVWVPRAVISWLCHWPPRDYRSESRMSALGLCRACQGMAT